MLLKKLFTRRKLWSIAIYKIENERDIFQLSNCKPFYFIGECGFRSDFKYQATNADPFLFVHEERIYVFYEIQTDFGVGEIWAHSMDSVGVWISHGRVLKEDFHLSYPQVFAFDRKIWMIPESASSGKVWLYVAELFPNRWRRVRVLINEPLVDPSIFINNEGIYLFGTTRDNNLRLYFAKDINESFILVVNSVTSDKAISRNGGRPLFIENSLYRVAQNCSTSYGQNIILLRIKHITKNKYIEEVEINDLYVEKPKWMSEGYHHLSVVECNNGLFVAVDGMRKDIFINTVSLVFLKFLYKLLPFTNYFNLK
jgi:hypothetical protein